MKRLLLTIEGRKCPFRCRYCFANFKQYKSPPSLTDLEANPESLLEGIDFIYPACDVDLFALRNPLEILTSVAGYGRSISVSTKAKLSEKIVSSLAKLNERMLATGCFLKVSVSFSSKFSLRKIEPRTTSFKSRLNNLDMLTACSVPNSAIIKPVLPEIQTSEYFSLVDSLVPVTHNIVLGELYLDSANYRMEKLGHPVDFKEVQWANQFPVWPVIRSFEKLNQISSYVESLGITCYNSDLEFMSKLQDQFCFAKSQHDFISSH
jgi:DNA repair photolyase